MKQHNEWIKSSLLFSGLVQYFIFKFVKRHIAQFSLLKISVGSQQNLKAHRPASTKPLQWGWSRCVCKKKRFIFLNQSGCILYFCKIKSDRSNEVCETNIQYLKSRSSAGRAAGSAPCECEDNSNYENWKENKWKSSSGERGERSFPAEQTHRVIDSERGRLQPRVHAVMIAL